MDLGEEAVDAALVAVVEHIHALVLVLTTAGPCHLALQAVHDLAAAGKSFVRPRVKHLLAQRVAARQRLRARAESKRSLEYVVWRVEARVEAESAMRAAGVAQGSDLARIELSGRGGS